MATPCRLPYPRIAPPRVQFQADGFTYERSAIEQWLENHNTSPKTGIELESKQLVRTTRSAASSKTFTSRARSGTNVIALRAVASSAGGSVLALEPQNETNLNHKRTC